MTSSLRRQPAATTPAHDAEAADSVFSQLFNEHASYVVGLLRRLGVRTADVQDVAQEVFLIVYRKLPGFEGRSSTKTWISGIAVHLAANYRRRAVHRREQLAADPSPPLGQARDAAREWTTLRERDALLSALDALHPAQREIFVLCDIEEMPMASVCKLLGCPLFTGYTRLRAARKSLQQRLQPLGIREPARGRP